MKPNGMPRFLGEVNVEGDEDILDDAFENVISNQENEENNTTIKQNFC